jgi:hypothetical protein
MSVMRGHEKRSDQPASGGPSASRSADGRESDHGRSGVGLVGAMGVPFRDDRQTLRGQPGGDDRLAHRQGFEA